MPGIFVFSEKKDLARQLLGAGLQLKTAVQQPLCAITSDASEANELISLGAEKVFVLKSSGTWAEGLARAIAAVAVREQAAILLIGGTLRGKDIAAKAAALMKAGLISDALTLKFAGGTLTTTRMLYGGLAVAEDTAAVPVAVTIPPRTFAAPAPDAARKGETHSEGVTPDTRVAISNVQPVHSEGVNVAAASKLVSVGRGFQKKEDIALADALAKALGAEVSCSRPVAEDLHWMPVERYVGISGEKVEPQVYLAVGISGQIQHVAGIRGSKIIVAVNTDEHAPIFAAADYGVVADLYEILPLLTKAV